MLYQLYLSSTENLVPYEANVSIVEFIAFRGNFSLSTTFTVFRIPDFRQTFRKESFAVRKKVLPWKSKWQLWATVALV